MVTINTREIIALARYLFINGKTYSEVVTALIRSGVSGEQARKIANAVHEKMEQEAKA